MILLPATEENTPLHLAGSGGRAVLLFVLGIDCGSCKQLARSLSELRYEYSPEIEFVGICIQNACEEGLAEFADETHTSFPLRHCTNRDLCNALSIPRSTWLYFPTLIAIDSQQQLRGVFTGQHQLFNDTAINLRMLLDELSPVVRSVSERVEATL
ncbi:redoxin family protein [Granulicella sp. L60]|uniref:TlpA family protein disulfide reductase n=1 Tax=Granulicella sp. L60 TaxID=1641866 RepID=UPI001C2091CD|nr:redoxin family protein [Granulicella sp. L60]